MINRIITSIFCASLAIAAIAQTETPDSIKTQHLDEVVVEAQMQRTSPTSITYIPTGKQKNASQNAVDLLRQMAMSQIQINPVSEAVTDNAGGEVAIFINFLEASKEEMEGLRTPDVKKVEYLEFPTDPRFRGAQRVINIIVQEYAYGGYTKLTTNENFLVGFSSRNNIFSKFSYKNTFNRSNPNRNNSLAYQGSFFFSLPNQFSIDISPRFNYMHSNDYLTYSTSTTPEIVRNARENAYNYRVDAYLQKRIGQKHTAMLGVNGGDNINRLRYSGTNSYYDRFHNAFAAGMLCYNFQTQKISLYADAGVCWEGSDINGEKYNDTYPFTHINLRFSPNSKNAFSAYFQYATNSPGINQKASDILQENEYMYITGNPLLKNSRHVTLNVAYTWMPTNAFGMSAFSNFLEYFDRQIIIYEPYNNGQALIRNYHNSGNYIKEEIGLAANWKLLGGKLQLYASPKQSFYKSTGIYNKSYNPFTITAQATYYLNSFYFQAYYQSSGKQMFTSSPQIYKDRNFHSLTVGWANSDWNVRVMAANFFNKGWNSADIVTESPLYTEYRENIGTSSHFRINITATYTFGYGKKVQRGNEVGEQSGANSAIIK